MQGLADGYFVIPYTVGAYFAQHKTARPKADAPEFAAAEGEVRAGVERLLAIKGKRPADLFHRDLGKVLWEHCGMARTEASLRKALAEIPRIRERFWKEALVLGANEEVNIALERAGRIADYLEFAELMCLDALERNESAGGHFRVEYQTPEGEAARNDDAYAYVAAWEWKGADSAPALHKEPLVFENIQLQQRSYK
jgi:succinate dehydrogenase / fumarate reductase flavoprotein subunit